LTQETLGIFLLMKNVLKHGREKKRDFGDRLRGELPFNP